LLLLVLGTDSGLEEETPDCLQRSLVRVGTRVRAMKDCVGFIKKHGHPRAAALDHDTAESQEQCLDIPPLDVRRQRLGKDRRRTDERLTNLWQVYCPSRTR
jgi:hypothetical protein